MSRETILVVEDEQEILELIRYNLTREGYLVSCVSTGENALKSLRSGKPDLVVLDLMLPGVDGLEVCKTLKSDPSTQDFAVVMLTAKGEDTDIVIGLELGADDYITKPFSPRVLIARIRAVLRRKTIVSDDKSSVIEIHGMVIHPGRHEVLVDGKTASLTPTEFRVLQVLARRPGWVLTRHQISDAVHGSDYIVTDRSIDVQIASLRKKLGSAGKHIETVHGVGYRCKE